MGKIKADAKGEMKMAIEYTVYANIEAVDDNHLKNNRDDCWHPSEERDLAVFESLEKAEMFLESLPTNALLKEQPCKRCGGSGKKNNKIIYGNKVAHLDNGKLSKPENNTCPECQGSGKSP